MTPKPTFAHLNVSSMIAAAGGDPWAVEDQLRAGDAGAINDLAEAFHRAGTHVQDADDQFNKAKEQFKTAYDRNNGSEHPINDSAEVQRMSARLAGHPEKLSAIGVALEQTAAALATAQREALAEVGELNTALHSVDDEITSLGSALTPLQAMTLLKEADDQTAMSLGTLLNIHGAYVDQLHSAETVMGYMPDALADADAVPGNSSQEAAEQYKDSGQLAKDRKTVADVAKLDPTSRLRMPELSEAQHRLDDYSAITDPDNKDISKIWYVHGEERADAQHMAGERLDDWNMAMSSGPVPKDPVLGGDMRDRAKARLTMQRQLQDAQLPWSQVPMSADDATKLMDKLEMQDRVTTLNRLQEELQTCGMTAEGAASMVNGISRGVMPQEYLSAADAVGKVFESGDGAVAEFNERLPRGAHWKPGIAFNEADIEVLEKFGGRLGAVGSAVDLGVGLYDIFVNHASPVDVAAKAGGGMAGAWALGQAGAYGGGFVAGPPGAFVGALLLGTAGAFGGEKIAERAVDWVTN